MIYQSRFAINKSRFYTISLPLLSISLGLFSPSRKLITHEARFTKQETRLSHHKSKLRYRKNTLRHPARNLIPTEWKLTRYGGTGSQPERIQSRSLSKRSQPSRVLRVFETHQSVRGSNAGCVSQSFDGLGGTGEGHRSPVFLGDITWFRRVRAVRCGCKNRRSAC